MDNIILYAVKNKNLSVRLESRSGGIFTALSDEVLSKGGVVYGCVLDENLRAIHVRTENKKERDLMRGSKYVQSDLGSTFAQAQKDVEEGRYVMFSGTSCQIAGLRKLIGNASNIVYIDILCHGVPSPKIWRDYLTWQEKKHHSKIQTADFRNKKMFGWAEHIETLYFKSGKIANSKVYTNIFYSLNAIRPACFKCPYKKLSHPGDITIADYWGIDEAVPNFSDNNGVSLVFINTDNGKKLFEKIKTKIDFVQTKVEKCMLQKPLVEPYKMPPKREEFWLDYNQKGFSYVMRKYYGYGGLNKVKRIIRKIFNILLKLKNRCL